MCRASSPRSPLESGDEFADMPELIDDVSDDEQAELRMEKRFEHMQTYRAKWLLDGCSTILEMADRLRGEIQYLEDLHEKGWKLESAMSDDYAHLIPPNIDQLVEDDLAKERRESIDSP